MNTCKRCNKEKDETHDCKTYSCIWCTLDNKQNEIMTKEELNNHYNECKKNKEKLATKLLQDYTKLREMAIKKEDAVEYLKEELYNRKTISDNICIHVEDNKAILESQIDDYLGNLTKIFVAASQIQCNMNLQKLITKKISIDSAKKVTIEFLNGEILEDEDVIEMLKQYSKK